MPVAVEDGVLGRLLAAEVTRTHQVFEFFRYAPNFRSDEKPWKLSYSPAEDGGEHAVVRVPDQVRVQLRVGLPHVHNVHLQIDTPRKFS